MSFLLASDLKTHKMVWIDKNGKELDPIQVCASYRIMYADDVKTPEF